MTSHPKAHLHLESPVADIKKSGLTTGKATIAAQELYQTSQKYGPNAETMLNAYQPGQDPKRFASGFQNAYILGTLGKHTALQDSKAAAYLTQQQRELAYDIGVEMQNEPWRELLPSRQQNRPEDIPTRATQKLAQGFAAFAQGDPLGQIIGGIIPEKGKFDVALRGSPTAVAFGSENANMSARLLAQIIKRSDGYNGQPIRLLSSCTGYSLNGDFSFAQELANALGTTVWAPNDLIFYFDDGTFRTGENGKGFLVEIKPKRGN